MAPLMTSLLVATVLLAGQVLAQPEPQSTSGPTCCPRKTVAYVTYTLVSEAETGSWGCSANCVYQIAGRPGNKYCFKPGRYPSSCGLTPSPDMECPELMAFKEACKVRDTANMGKDEALYYVLKKIIMDINETNIRIDMLEERVNITETHIKELWKETIIINERIDQLNETIYKLICKVDYIETTQQTVIKSAKRISEVVARVDQHGAHCGYRAKFTEAQTVVTYDSIFTNDGIGSMDAATGKWVSGVSGTYAISMSAYTHLDRRDQNMINLLKNGVDVGKWGEWMFGFVGDDMGGRSLVLKLALGDELTLKTGAMAAAEGENTQTDVKDLDFCVFLIYADKPDGGYTKDPIDQQPNECQV